MEELLKEAALELQAEQIVDEAVNKVVATFRKEAGIFKKSPEERKQFKEKMLTAWRNYDDKGSPKRKKFKSDMIKAWKAY